MSSTRLTPSKTARQIRVIMDALDLGSVGNHFEQDDDEIDPYVVCDGVSVAAFNKYIGDGEGLRIAVRFLDLSDDGRILIVDFPTPVHEIVTSFFEDLFLAATGSRYLIGRKGSMTAHQAGRPNKEGDATYGPMGTTPNRTQPPHPLTVADWVTLAVEVGRSQTWASLEAAAQWWCGYPGIQYILLLKVSAPGTQIAYRLYEINVLHILPPPSAVGTVRRTCNRPGPAANVTFDMHRILSIPVNQGLPNGINANAVVNLRTVLNLVIDSMA